MISTITAQVASPDRHDIGGQAELPASNRILQVAEELFLKKGYNATTIREIAATSKVSNATIVKYFGDKSGLFVSMVAQFTERLISATSAEFADFPEQGLKIWGSAVLHLLLEPEMVMAARHLYSDVSMRPRLGQAYIVAGPAKLAANLSLQLKRWANLGRFPHQDFVLAAEWFMHLLGGGIYQQRLIGLQTVPTEADIDATVCEATRIFMAAFGSGNTGQLS